MREITPEEAFDVAIRYGFCGDCRWKLESELCIIHDCYQRVKFVKEAVEKQIPKKPEWFEVIPFCKCGAELDYFADYCSECGQAIDWKEE